MYKPFSPKCQLIRYCDKIERMDEMLVLEIARGQASPSQLIKGQVNPFKHGLKS
jgi:hypothetical protein